MHDVLLQTPGNVGDRLRRLDDEHAVEALLEQFVVDLSLDPTTRNCSPRPTVITSPIDQFGTAVTSIAESGG